ncbi:ornithine--oxo-acid transaminase [Elusimicrobiota bacterium]
MTANKNLSKEHIELCETYSAKNYHPLPVVLSHGQGSWVYDVEGKKNLDMLSGYSALNQGHTNEEIIKALTEQAKQLTLTSRAFLNDQMGPFCKELAQLCGMDKVLPMNTGAEAVETAIKTARKWGYTVKGIPMDKAEIITCAANFHGRTISVITFSTEELYTKYFGPYTPGFKSIPFADTDALENAITKNTAAFLVEPIQCEAGIIVPPKDYFKKVREICTKNNVMLIMDEIQTGLGRTGKMFSFEHEGIRPDLLILGKALGGGVLPISAVVGPKNIMDVFIPGEHGSTFGGNPLACAVARAALKVLIDNKLHERSEKLGKVLFAKLATIKSPHVKEIRGRGLIVGIELKDSAKGARRFCEALMEDGLLTKETHENVIRMAPPLTISEEDLDLGFNKVKKVLETLK